MGKKRSSSVSQVMECPQLVSMIAERLGRRDRARCCAVSKLWAECCEYVSRNVKQLGYLLAMQTDRTLWLCNPNTGEEHVVTLSFLLYPYKYVRIRAACQGLVLISIMSTMGENTDLIIGEPLINQWKLLPRLDCFEAAGLRRTESGGVELIAVNSYGDVYKFDFQEIGWIRESTGFGRVGIGYSDAVYHRSLFYFCLYHDEGSEEPGVAEVWQYDSSSATWTEMEHGHVLNNRCASFLESQGRLLIYVVDHDLFRKDHHNVYELVDGKVVETPCWLDAAIAIDSSWHLRECAVCCCMDDEFFWITSSDDVIKHSRRDMSFTKLVTGCSQLLDYSLSYYFPDEGEALWQFGSGNGQYFKVNENGLVVAEQEDVQLTTGGETRLYPSL